MASTSLYGIGPYGFDWYSFHMGADFSIGVISWSAPMKRIQSVAAVWAVGTVAWTAPLRRIQTIAASYVIGPLSFIGAMQATKNLAGQITVTYNVTGWIFFWQGITDVDGDWSEVAVPNPNWEIIDTPPAWN